MNQDNKTRVTLTIEQSLKHEVSLVAVEDRRDLSAEICVLVREALAHRKAQIPLTGKVR